MALLRKNGELSSYAIKCGYVKVWTNKDTRQYVRLEQAGNEYQVKSSVYGLDLWRNFTRYNEALKEYNRVMREIGN